jgi:tetratricopeptide (TPR) repeat protein/glycosyltransferase involved in cell wall biosynthesis
MALVRNRARIVSMSKETLRQIASEILASAPAGSISPMAEQALSAPTRNALYEVALALLAGGHVNAAERVFRALLDILDFGYRAAVGLARVAAQRGDPAAAAAAWQSCLNSFPERSRPQWYVELARAQCRLERNEEAAECLRQCIRRFPAFAPAIVQLAVLLTTLGRPEEALIIWRDLIQNSFDGVKSPWISGFAKALRSAGQDEHDDVLMAQLAERFPKEPATLAFRARQAARREDWNGALSLWEQCANHETDEGALEYLKGRAMALLRLWRADEALGVWQDLVKRYPHSASSYGSMAAAAEELGQWALAADYWSMLIERFPDRVRPDWLFRHSICLVHHRPDPAIYTAIEALETRFPESPLGRRIALQLAYRQNLGLKSVAPLVEDAVRRFPAERKFLMQRVRIMLATGRLSDAEVFVRELEAENDHLGLISRWRLAADQDGEQSIREQVWSVVAGHPWTLEPGLELTDFLLALWSPWAIDVAVLLCNDLSERFPGRAAVAYARAKALVMQRNDQRALEVIDSVPAVYQAQELLELRAWAAARRDDEVGARRLWQSILATYYFPAVHAPEPRLELILPEPAGTTHTGVTVFVPVRNERAQLPEFLGHYRRLGVRRFIVVDNMSTDGSEIYLGAQPDVVLYRTADNFQAANCGMRWVNALIERHGAGGWCLFADADEAFIYPGWESTPLALLTEYLDQTGAEAVAAFMLDVFPERLTENAENGVTWSDCRYYDGDYQWIGHVRPPYARPVGGARSRLFGAQEYLHKIPLIKSGRAVYIDNHESTSARFAVLTGVLLHYKILGLGGKFDNPQQDGNQFQTDYSVEMMRRYARYAARLPALDGVELRMSAVSQMLTDSLSLADRGLMRAPSDFRLWLERVGLPAAASPRTE